MTATVVFDGVEYPDSEASDPNALKWLHGSPPPARQRVRLDSDRIFAFPEIRWSLSHAREMLPTVAVWRGSSPPSKFEVGTGEADAAIDSLEFNDLDGRSLTWARSLSETYTDGILVVHRGVKKYERYFGALLPHRPHACFSITKSYAATLAEMLIHEGTLDGEKTIAHYVPDMDATAYADATLRQVLDMQVGVDYSELYADPHASFWNYARAGGLRSRGPNYTGPTNYYDYLLTLRKAGPHGGGFEYKTVNTEVLCWVMHRVTGMALADQLSDRIWSQIGCEEDGYLTVDSIGIPMGGAGLYASLRDLARFGELMRCEGAYNGRQIIPAEVVAGIWRGSDCNKFATAGYDLLRGYSYRSMWWVSHNSLGVIEGRGIHGQRLYIAPKAELVIARYSSHPIAASAANDIVTMPAFAALAEHLMRN